MPTTFQFRRGTTAQNNSFTGAVGELSIDTDLDSIRVHDGSTAGGFEVQARQAKYADVAERYEADAVYEPGTVLVLGGEKEVTRCNGRLNRRVIGVVSTEPYCVMNSPHREPDKTDELNPAVALLGRVPCKVIGSVRKGDLMITGSEPGYAEAWREEGDPPVGTVFGKAVENKEDRASGIITVVVGIK
jgi:hypothetical protein